MLQQNELKDEVKRVSEAIRKIFHVEGDLEEADLESLHNQLIECVEAVNERLRRCDDLLRKGLRGEAIQESETAPNLLELVTELDFPEWDAWSDYVRQFSIPPQPDLLVDVAVALNEAYNEAQPLDNLLRLHRLHALARSPLKDRIAILRGIAGKDAANHVWREDLQSYERHRLQQVEQELRQFRQERNVRALGELRQELADSAWLVPAPPKLVQQAAAAHDEFRAAAARQKLAAIEREINAAFSDFNVQRAELARQEWDKYAEIVNLTADDELYQRVAPAFDWLDQEADDEQRRIDYERVLAGLENGLDNDALTKTDLMRLFNDVERFEGAIPERVQRRYSERMRTLETGETRRGRLILLATFATLLLLGGITAFAIFWQIRSSQIRSACDGLAKLLADGQVSEADAYYQRIESETPFIAVSNPMKKLQAQLAQAVKEESGRQQRMQQHIDRALALAETESTWERLSDATRELEEAEAIANGEHERLPIKNAELAVQRERTRLQNEVDEQFSNEVGEIADALKRIDDLDRAQLKELHSRATQLERRSRVSASVKQGSGITAIVRRLADRDFAYEIHAKKRAALDRVVKAIGDATSYRLALNSYATSLQLGNRVKEFQRVAADELQFIPVVEKWNGLAKRWNRLSFDNPHGIGTEGGLILKDIDASFRDFPSASEALALTAYLGSIAKQFEGAPILDRLGRLFTSVEFRLKHVEFLQDGRKVYFANSPKREDFKELTIRALTSTQDFNEGKDATFYKIQLRKFDNQSYADAPQVILATQVTGFLGRNDPEQTFERKICGVLILILENPDMDPLLKGLLLQKVVEIGKPGSVFLADELKEFERAIHAAGELNQVNWIDSEDIRVTQKRVIVANILERLHEHPKDIFVRRIGPKVAAARQSKPTLAELVWVGMLLKDEEDGAWTCRLGEDANGLSGELWMRDYAQSKAGKFVKIGSLAVGQAQMAPEGASTMTEGRPVWLVRQPE